MRLLDAKTYRLWEFTPLNTPPYAILSHVWAEEEVTFQDLRDGRGPRMKGYDKIVGTCELTRQAGLDYCWIDTCCIDKTSSAELTEAINSMFQWYRDAQICYAYLADVKSTEDHKNPAAETSFTRSRWWTRGWTLQELIAPPSVTFIANDWRAIGSRWDDELVAKISERSGIQASFFIDKDSSLAKFSVAQRMSWASGRVTTRIEDQAYCLLGIFRVNMPLLYGEGAMAFTRLQEEIMARSDDDSIFAWRASPRTVTAAATTTMTTTTTTQGSFGTGGRIGGSGSSLPLETGLLASSPADFAESGDVVKGKQAGLPPYTINNRGVQITLPVVDASGDKAVDLPFVPLEDETLAQWRSLRFRLTPTGTLALLSCRRRRYIWDEGLQVGIFLDRRDGEDAYHRCNHDLKLVAVPAGTERLATVRRMLVRRTDAPDAMPLWAPQPSELSIELVGLPADDTAFGPYSIHVFPDGVVWGRARVDANVNAFPTLTIPLTSRALSGGGGVRAFRARNDAGDVQWLGPERAVIQFRSRSAKRGFCLLLARGMGSRESTVLVRLDVGLDEDEFARLAAQFLADDPAAELRGGWLGNAASYTKRQHLAGRRAVDVRVEIKGRPYSAVLRIFVEDVRGGERREQGKERERG